MPLVTKESIEREYNLKYINRLEGAVLPIGELVISERCKWNCPYCGIDAKPDGELMSWELFKQVVKSDQITFELPNGGKRVFLGDAEVLTWRDEQVKVGLLDIFDVLARVNGLEIQFTTAGLVPPNRKIGLTVLENLNRGGLLLSRLSVVVSFTLMHKIPIEKYLECMQETFYLLTNLGVKTEVRIIHNGSNLMQTQEAFNKVPGHEFVTSQNPQGVIPCGRALMNFTFTPQVIETKQCSLLVEDIVQLRPIFAVKPNGGVTIDCGNFGASRGSTLGNVYSNDALGIHLEYGKFLAEFKERSKERPIGVYTCEHHRTWGKRFTPPVSERPIVPRKMRKIA